MSEVEKKIFNERSKYIDKLKFSKKKYNTQKVKEELDEIIKNWYDMGEINQNSLNILNRDIFKKLSTIISKLDIDNTEKSNLIFDLEIDLYKSNESEVSKKIQFIKRKISEFKDESIQLQNNLEFFSNSSSDNPLFKNVSSKIDSINNNIELWTERLRKVEKG